MTQISTQFLLNWIFMQKSSLWFAWKCIVCRCFSWIEGALLVTSHKCLRKITTGKVIIRIQWGKKFTQYNTWHLKCNILTYLLMESPGKILENGFVKLKVGSTLVWIKPVYTVIRNHTQYWNMHICLPIGKNRISWSDLKQSN